MRNDFKSRNLNTIDLQYIDNQNRFIKLINTFPRNNRPSNNRPHNITLVDTKLNETQLDTPNTRKFT